MEGLREKTNQIRKPNLNLNVMWGVGGVKDGG